MSRFRLVVAGITLLSALASAGPPRELSLAGTINGTRRIRMNLHVAAGLVSGDLMENGDGRKIAVRGAARDDGTLSLDELAANGEAVATFEGKWLDPGRVEGRWRERGGLIARPFALDQVRPEPGWPGHWGAESNQVNWESFLDIREPSPRTLAFVFTASAGAHGCEISGTATARGGRAAWRDADSGCELAFTLTADAIEVAVKGDCSSFCGARAVLGDGRFRRGQSSLTQTLAERYLLEEETEKVLAGLAGGDYELFVKSFQEGEERDLEDLDGLGAEVTAGGVRGLYTIQEAIIMTAPGPRVWAAVIDPGPGSVKYFTNDPARGGKLPRTIDDWRKNFSEKPVIFANASRPPAASR